MQKFALRNYAGKPTAYYQVVEQHIQDPDVSDAPDLSHHIMVVDRSGSMYYDIENLKNTLLKLLTLEEFTNAQLLVSLISYSSHGDVTLHFDRVTVQDVMAVNSAHQAEIKRIRVTGLTCISQAMEMAKGLIQEGEMTALTLHSDGYANDRSPSSEKRSLESVCTEIAKQGDVFINTIAYSSYSDFNLLSMVANIGAGTCIRANNIKQVYDALQATTQTLTSNVTPTLVEGIREDSYQAFVSISGRKINGSDGDIKVCGIKADDDKVIYRYREIDQATYEALNCGVSGEGGPATPIYAFARAQLSEGNINTAKYALVATRNTSLLDAHSRALTNPEIALFATALDAAIFDIQAYAFSKEYGLDMSQTTVLAVVEILDGLARGGHLEVDLQDLKAHYIRRGLSRVNGTRDEDGKLIKPDYKIENTDAGDFAPIKRFEINQNTANINMLVSRPARLAKTAGGHVDSIAGINLDGKLQTHNNYTVVGNGEITLPTMAVRIGSKKGFRALVNAGVLSGDFDPASVYPIDFAGRPLIGFDQKFGDLDDVFELVAGMKALASILGACLKEQSEDFTAEQIKALKEHHLSTRFNFSPPTTNAYTDLQEALATGKVDSRLSYKIDIGSTDILNASKIKSANAFLQRLFTMDVEGEKAKKPVFGDFWKATGFGYKTLSARTKVTKADEFQKRIFEEFLGLAETGGVVEVMSAAGIGSEIDDLLQIAKDPSADKDGAVEVMTKVKREVEAAKDRLIRERVSPLAFYVGSTGLIPDDLGAKAYTAEDLVEEYPSLVLSKAEKDGTFFVVGDRVVSVYTKSEHFTPEARS